MKVAITFPNHWAIKNLLHSGVVELIQGQAEVIGIAHPSRIPHLQNLATELKLAPIQWAPYVPPEEPKTLTVIRKLQKAFVYERRQVATERVMRTRGKRSKGERFVGMILRWAARSPWANTIENWLDQQRWQLTPCVEVPLADILFTTNPVDYREDPLVKSAKTEMRIVTMIPSWDNLSSKGVLFTDFDEVYVWNEIMQDEVVSLKPSIAKASVPIIGIPRFAIYERAAADKSPRRRILFANTATKSFPDQPAVVRHLAEALAKGEFGDSELFVRCHPHDNPRDYAFLRSYRNVTVWPDSIYAFGVDTVPPPSDLTTLAETLQSSDVCVNCASTIVLDAAANDVPIVSVAYDGDRNLPLQRSVAQFYDYTHQKPFLESQAADIVATRDDLIKAVQEALANPAKRRAQRSKLALLATSGEPHVRLAQALLNGDGSRRAA